MTDSPATPSTIERLLRPHFRTVEPYASIEPVEVLSARLGIPPEQIIKLDGNENLWGPSPRALAALAEFRGYHIYPDPAQRELREALAAYTGLPSAYLFAGNGSDELIDLLMRVTLNDGDEVITSGPTFGMYSFNTGVCAGVTIDVPRDASFAVPVEAVAAAVTSRSKMIILPSPNNPSGNLLPRADLLRLLELGLLVVLDEAYGEFAGESGMDLAAHYENLVVLRTFSKWAGLAGLRVGYGAMSPRLVQLLDHIKPPYNVNVAALVAARASLDDADLLMQRVGNIVTERERMAERLMALPFLRVYPSWANFLLCDVTQGSAVALKDFLMNRGIFVRHYTSARLRNSLRISVGLPEHTDSLLEAMYAWGEGHV